MPTIWELVLFLMSAGVGVAVAAALWILYVALESETRRRWPHVLVSWTRVLFGQWRDALVGRDVLIGTATGVYAVLVLPYFAILTAGWLGLQEPPQRTVVM